MTNKLVVIINSLKVPKIKEILLYEMLPPPDPHSLCPQLNLLNPPPEKNSWVRHWTSQNRYSSSTLAQPVCFQFIPCKCGFWNSQYYRIRHNLMYSFIPLVHAECDDSLPFSAASSIPLCCVLFSATLLHQLFFHPISPHLAIYFLVCLSILFFPKLIYNSLFGEFYFLPFSVHAQTNVIYLTLLSLL